MLFDQNEDPENKTATVRPNDVIDVEISPSVAAKSQSWFNAFTGERKKQKHITHKIVTKQRRPKRLKPSSTCSIKQPLSEMKRGDPFLPSVMADENPIAEYTTKKTVPKKPSDCKCKGMGYNCSPSAILPEEMRQQWGCGMLGKATPSRSAVSLSSESFGVTRSIASYVSIPENPTVPSTTYCASNNCSFSISPKPVTMARTSTICWECKTYPCICFSTAPRVEPIFLANENDERRKQKLMNKGGHFKSKGSKTRLLINATNSSSTVKRITCFNKENNIISTSNFSRGTFSPLDSVPDEGGGYFFDNKFNQSLKTSNKARNDSYQDRLYATGGPDYISTPRFLSDSSGPMSRYRHRFRSSRRGSKSISPSAITTANGPYGDARVFDNSHQRLPVSSKQMFMTDPQVCYCERCKRRVQLLSKMEALGFPSSSAHPKPHLYSHPTTQQRYMSSTMPFPTQSQNRYFPYSPYSYNYPHAMWDGGSYPSPEDTSPISDVAMIGSKGDNMFQSSSSHINPADAFSYFDLDTDQMLDSPLSSNETITDDIMELSVKDTVDFFMGLKSPLADTLSPSCDSLEPAEPVDPFKCSFGSDEVPIGSGWSLCASLQEDTGEETQLMQSFVSQQGQRFNVSGGQHELPATSMPKMYSSLITDLEDELKCAIENIPLE